MRLRALARIVLSALLALGLAASPRILLGQAPGLSPSLPVTHIDHGPNSAWAQSQHYVVLVSLDGFRWDYAKRDNATHLLALAKQGVWAPGGMLPSYPSLTFPNHYTIVTGLYPEHHGLVANSFLDPVRGTRYSMADPQAVTDG
ncbi:MAG: alkaline phosphatase family protein, partial [Terracidiphilus sp.]